MSTSRIKPKKCSFVGCQNNSKNRPDIRYFNYSGPNIEKWIAASGNAKLNELKKKNLCTNYFVCSDHFKKSDYRTIPTDCATPLSLKMRFPLKRRVVPLPYNYVSWGMEGHEQLEMEESTGHEGLGECNEEDSKSSKIPVKKTKKCVYINCGNNSKNQPEMKFFRFPTSNYKDWIVASGNVKLNELKMKNLCTNYYVCCNHFKKAHFRTMASPFTMRFPLKRRVVPLPYNHVSLDMEGEDELEMEESTGHEDRRKCSKEGSKSFKIPVKKKKKCSFVNCGSNSQSHPEMKFFRFPRSNYKEWIAASGCDKLNTVKESSLYSGYFVCSNHFRLTDCKKILSPSKTDAPLKSGVVPVPFNYGNPRMEAEQSDVQSSSEKAKSLQPASKKSKTSQSSTNGNSTICLPDSSPTSQMGAESTSQTSQSIINISYQNFSLKYGGDPSTYTSAGVFLRDVKREDSEHTLSNLRPDQTQGKAFSHVQKQNNQNCDRSMPFFAPEKPTLAPLSEVSDQKSCSKVATGSDDDEFFGGDEICFESFVDDEENQMYIDDNKYDKTDDRVIERRTSSCSKEGSEAESNSKEKVQMHHESEFERDDLKVVSEASMDVGTSSSQSTKVVEDKSVNFKDSAGNGSILSSASSVGAAREGGSEKLDVIVTAGAKTGLTSSSVASAASTTIITDDKGCSTVAKINTGSSLLSASPIATEVQLFLRLPTGQTIPVKVPVAALMSASSMPSPSPLCLPPPVQQVVELPQQASSTQSVSDVSPASDPLTGHQPGPSPAASDSDAPEGPTNDCSSEPQKGKKRKKCIIASSSEDDEETKEMKALERKRVASAKRQLRRQKQRERELKIAPRKAEPAPVNSRLASEVASLKAEVTSLKDLLLQHMTCSAPRAPTVRGANPLVIAAANPVVGANSFVIAAANHVVGANPFVVAAGNPFVVRAANPAVGANRFVVAAERPKVAAAHPVIVAAEGPKVAGANPGVVAAEGPKVAGANPGVVAAEGPKVAGANPGVVAAEGPKVAGANPGVVAAEGPKVAGANPVIVAAEGPKVAGANPGVVAAEGPKVAAANPVVVAAEGLKGTEANPVVVAADGPKGTEANPVVVAAEGPKVAEANPVVVPTEGPKVAEANPGEVAAEGSKVAEVNPGEVAAEGSKVAEVHPGEVAAEGPKVAEVNPGEVAAEGSKVAETNPGVEAAEGQEVAAVRLGQSSDTGHQLKRRSRSILPFRSKPAPSAYLVFKLVQKSKN